MASQPPFVSLHGRRVGITPNGLMVDGVLLGTPFIGDGIIRYVDSGVAASSGENPAEAVSTLQAAIDMTTADRGDIIVVMPGHAESITTATSLLLNKSNVTILGVGVGNKRPTFTFTTANTATIAVSAANIAVLNCRFVANFLSIAAPFTLSTAKHFTLRDCRFTETSNVLNFLNIVKSTGAANTVDGLDIQDCTWNGLGTTSVNSFVLTANDIDYLIMRRNTVKLARTADAAALLTVTAGILTQADISDNYAYTAQTAVTNGSLVNLGGTTSTGWMVRNFVQTQNVATAADKMVAVTTGLTLLHNSSAMANSFTPLPFPSPVGMAVPNVVATSTLTASSALTTGTTPVTLFTVTGQVRSRVWAVVGTLLTSTSNTGTLSVGVTGLVQVYMPTTTADGTTKLLAAGVWAGAATDGVARAAVAAAGSLAWVHNNAGNIICTVATNSMTAGTITFYCEWTPVTAGASVVAAV